VLQARKVIRIYHPTHLVLPGAAASQAAATAPGKTLFSMARSPSTYGQANWPRISIEECNRSGLPGPSGPDPGTIIGASNKHRFM